MAFKIRDIDETQAPLLDHLIELRNRLVRCVLALAVAFAVCFYFADEIFALLVHPLAQAFPPGQGKLIYTKLYEAFFVEIKVALFAAFLVTFPIIANQLWAFVAPGLYCSPPALHSPISSSCRWHGSFSSDSRAPPAASRWKPCRQWAITLTS